MVDGNGTAGALDRLRATDRGGRDDVYEFLRFRVGDRRVQQLLRELRRPGSRHDDRCRRYDRRLNLHRLHSGLVRYFTRRRYYQARFESHGSGSRGRPEHGLSGLPGRRLGDRDLRCPRQCLRSLFQRQSELGGLRFTTSLGTATTGSTNYDINSFVFAGLLSTNTQFTSATFFSTDAGLGSYNVPLIVTASVPEPSSLLLGFIGLTCCGVWRARRHGFPTPSPRPGG